ncbi:hypothetical protein ACLAF4_004870 [Escherichia coli]
MVVAFPLLKKKASGD